MLELNEVCLQEHNAIDGHTLSMMAEEEQLTCLHGGSAGKRSRLLLAMLGLEPVANGVVSVDGEPVTPATARTMRRQMAYVPDGLEPQGEVTVYEAPTEDDVFRLRANRHQRLTQEALEQEMNRVADPSQWKDSRVKLLAVAALLERPIVLVDNPPVFAADYLLQLARQGRVVIVSSDEDVFVEQADQVLEL
ncbi:MAG: ATP-binding cassette domain-containing protein [Prevotella sp.]|nr:ATP-binding cassette domain-containing protein [Prevotella sp.]